MAVQLPCPFVVFQRRRIDEPFDAGAELVGEFAAGQTVGDDFVLIADGGISDGYDAFKVMALGATAVSVGRPLMEPLAEGGPEAMARVIGEFTGELRAMMARTGTGDLKHMDPSVIRVMSF